MSDYLGGASDIVGYATSDDGVDIGGILSSSGDIAAAGVAAGDDDGDDEGGGGEEEEEEGHGGGGAAVIVGAGGHGDVAYVVAVNGVLGDIDDWEHDR